MQEIIENKTDISVETKPTLKDIFMLQQIMLQLDDKLDVNEGLTHTFHDGVYAREMKLPMGMLIIGKVHKHSHINIVSRGRCIVYTTEGIKTIDATVRPVTFISSPGTKRVVYSLEDTYWTTIHLTNETDLKKVEDEIIIPESNFNELLESIEIQKIIGEEL